MALVRRSVPISSAERHTSMLLQKFSSQCRRFPKASASRARSLLTLERFTVRRSPTATNAGNGLWRSSVGASLIWASPFGPLRVDYAVPVLKEDRRQDQKPQFWHCDQVLRLDAVARRASYWVRRSGYFMNYPAFFKPARAMRASDVAALDANAVLVSAVGDHEIASLASIENAREACLVFCGWKKLQRTYC